jgi:hypothetical protein
MIFLFNLDSCYFGPPAYSPRCMPNFFWQNEILGGVSRVGVRGGWRGGGAGGAGERGGEEGGDVVVRGEGANFGDVRGHNPCSE